MTDEDVLSELPAARERLVAQYQSLAEERDELTAEAAAVTRKLNDIIRALRASGLNYSEISRELGGSPGHSHIRKIVLGLKD